MNLSDVTDAIKARLQSYADEHEIELLKEDTADLETEIDKAIGEVGMLILIGQPSWSNIESARLVSNNDLRVEIAVGEMPTVWRDAAGEKPVCEDVALRVAELLQGLAVAGFAPLSVVRGDHVADKQRQIYEIEVSSKFVIQKTTV